MFNVLDISNNRSNRCWLMRATRDMPAKFVLRKLVKSCVRPYRVSYMCSRIQCNRAENRLPRFEIIYGSSFVKSSRRNRNCSRTIVYAQWNFTWSIISKQRCRYPNWTILSSDIITSDTRSLYFPTMRLTFFKYHTFNEANVRNVNNYLA